MDNANDLSKLGNRELLILADLLRAYAYGEWESYKDNLDELADWGFNPESANVYLTDEDYHIAMLNENNKLENWLNCSNCGAEDWRSSLTLDEDGNCPACKGK